MNKLEAIIMLGSFEVRFEESEELQEEIQKLLDCIVDNRMVHAAIRFGRLKEMLRKLNIEEDEDVKEFQDWISSREVQVTLESPIKELGLSARAWNCLSKRGIQTVEQLTKMSFNDLRDIRNMGQNSLENIVNCLKEYGFKLSSDETN